MTVGRATLFVAAGFAGVLIWLLRVELGYAIVVGFMLRIAAHRMGYRPRRSSFASKVTAVSAAYGAWNTRWLKPKSARATVTSHVGAVDRPDDDIPF